MQIEKKLIAVSILAILIVIASIVSVMFLMTSSAKAIAAVDKPGFNLSIPYDYWNPNFIGKTSSIY